MFAEITVGLQQSLNKWWLRKAVEREVKELLEQYRASNDVYEVALREYLETKETGFALDLLEACLEHAERESEKIDRMLQRAFVVKAWLEGERALKPSDNVIRAVLNRHERCFAEK